MTVYEYAKYLLDNFPPDMIVMKYEDGISLDPPTPKIRKKNGHYSDYYYPEGVDQIVVI